MKKQSLTPKSLRIAIAQANFKVGDLDGNKDLILANIFKAKQKETDLIIFPELAISSYPPEDLLLKKDFLLSCKETLKDIAKHTQDIICCIGLPYLKGKHCYNSIAILQNKKILDFYHKNLLPNYSVFDEKRYFSRGKATKILNIEGIKINLSICEDIWSENSKTIKEAIKEKTNIIINLSASPYYFKKSLERLSMLKQRAIKTNNYIVYANLVGGQDELVFDGGSLFLDNKANVLAIANQFQPDLLIKDLKISIDKDEIANKKHLNLFIKNTAKTKKLNLVKNNFIKDELKEIFEALSLGLKDYVEKNKFQKVILGLSGGIDSALVLAIANYALGKNNIIALSMPSQYTSKETKSDASLMAKKLGIEFYELDINPIFKVFLDVLKPIFKKTVANVAEENIQARIRGNLLMAVANKFNYLLLTTGNKSEVAVGYCTLYGDMAGGFNPLKDVPKTLVYKVANWLNQKQIVIPQSIIKRPPSAELRFDQKDQDSLPSYDLLDKIIAAFVLDDLSFSEIIELGLPEQETKKTLSLIKNSEYKRRQAAIGIKISKKAFGKDWRMPLTNGYSA